MVRFVVAVPEGVPAALAQVVDQARAAEEAWWEQVRHELQERWLTPTTCRDRARWRREMTAARQLRAQLRQAGDLLGSRDRLVAHHVHAELVARGWDQEWPAVPAHEVSSPGRRWGVVSSPVPLIERLSVDLPDPLGARVRAAAHWSSAEATAALQEWWETFGDGPIVTDRLGGQAALLGRMLHALGTLTGQGPHRDDFAARAALRAQITTTADLVRAGIGRAITAGAPSAPPLPEHPLAPSVAS